MRAAPAGSLDTACLAPPLLHLGQAGPCSVLVESFELGVVELSLVDCP